ncbi:hypothetical protein [Embleya sp. NBC_00896]|uniref:hypothetical protein n=1 Tax=Embleya sp. NBC_00896 TaxID=2975961 RepID=UPI002F9110DC|nr:hypothetical protein OG928_35345 [Embleya sp. NBC_00896]
MRSTAPSRPRDNRAARDPRIDLLLVHAVHDALRRDLRRLVAWSRTCFPVTTPAWVDFHRRLTTHLDADTAVLSPVLRGKDLPGPDHARTAAEMERKRRRLTLLAETVDDCLSGRGPASRTAEYTACLDAALTEYLDYQRSVVLPLLATRITAREWADFDTAQRHPLGLTSGVALCAWLVDGAPPDRKQSIRRLFPPAVRLAHRWFGARHAHRIRWNDPAPTS